MCRCVLEQQQRTSNSSSPRQNRRETQRERERKKFEFRKQWRTMFLILMFRSSLLNPSKQQDCSFPNESNPTALGFTDVPFNIVSTPIHHHGCVCVFVCTISSDDSMNKRYGEWQQQNSKRRKNIFTQKTTVKEINKPKLLQIRMHTFFLP